MENFGPIFIIVQSLFESFPFSSSTHIIFLENILKKFKKVYTGKNSWEDFGNLATFFALLPIYFNIFFNLNNFIQAFLWVFIVDLITSLGYFLVKPKLRIVPIYCGLLITSFLLYSLNFKISYIKLNFITKAIFLGFLQVLAFTPGLSRLAITFTFLKFTGFHTFESWYFSWLGMMPLMFVRGAYGGFNLLNNKESIFKILVMLIISSILAYYSLGLMLYIFEFNYKYLYIYPLVMVTVWLIWKNYSKKTLLKK